LGSGLYYRRTYRRFKEGDKRWLSDKNMFQKGHKVSIEWREKIRKSKIGDNNPAKRLEVRRKISEAKKGKGYPHSEETKRKIGLANKGKKHTEETKKRISETRKEKIALGEISLNMLGKHHSEKTKKKISDMERGEKHWNWKGNISKQKGYKYFIKRRREIKKLGNGGSHTFGEWQNLKAQYNWTCPCCHKSEPFIGQKNLYLTEDHIIPIFKGGSNNIENIQPLCGSCNRKKWIKIIKYKEIELVEPVKPATISRF
jgi:5-methylcytosine-specific restriction endonuclease McrA